MRRLATGARPIYLDSLATTPTDPRVLDAMLPFMTSCVSFSLFFSSYLLSLPYFFPFFLFFFFPPLSLIESLTDLHGNPHSKTHAYGWETEKAVEEARNNVVSH